MMANKHRRILTACLSITPLFLVASPLASQITGTEVSINSRATTCGEEVSTEPLGRARSIGD
jgi:hypothetical protein